MVIEHTWSGSTVPKTHMQSSESKIKEGAENWDEKQGIEEDVGIAVNEKERACRNLEVYQWVRELGSAATRKKESREEEVDVMFMFI